MPRENSPLGFFTTVKFAKDIQDWKEDEDDKNNYFLTMETTSFLDPLQEK